MIRKIRFQGEPAVELTTRNIRLVVTTSRGPRIAFFGHAGSDNLLYWSPGKHRRGKWDLLGGHRLWTARPGADESEETYRPDASPATVEISRTGFVVTGTVDPETKLERALHIRTEAPGRIAIEHVIRNTSDMLWNGGAWALTCTKPLADDTYAVPLGDGSTWDYATVVHFKTWGGGHGQNSFADAQFQFTNDQFVLRPVGRENKRMLKADAGILAMHSPTRGVVFVKHATYDPAARYPLGTNLALYVAPGNFMVEMETMSGFTTLKPGDSLRHLETWLLAPAGAKPPTNAQLKRLVRP